MNHEPKKTGENWHFEPKVMLVSWKDGEGWENHQRNGEDEKLHSGKSTKVMEVDGRLFSFFHLGDVLGLQPRIFQGVVIFDSDKKNMRCKIIRVDKAILTNVPY